MLANQGMLCFHQWPVETFSIISNQRAVINTFQKALIKGNLRAGTRQKALAFGGPIAWLGMDGPEILFAPGEADGELSLRFSTPENYARALFHALRFLESSGASVIVAQRPGTDAGIALALRDRLERASSEEKKNSPEK